MEEKNICTVKLVGFNEAGSNNLTAILTLAYRALKKQWRIVNTDDADFFLLSMNATTDINSDEQLKRLPKERCVFCISKEQTPIEHALAVDEKHVPSLSALVKLFNQISVDAKSVSESKVTELTAQASPLVTPVKVISEQFFDAQKGLLGYLLASKHELLRVGLKTKTDYPALYIDVEKDIYYSENKIEQLQPYLMEFAELTIESCSKIALKSEITMKNLKPQPLKNLIWYIALITSDGKVIKGHLNTDIVTLKAWPDLKLFGCAIYAKVAVFMKNNSAHLETIAEYTKTPLAEINNFYNACYLMGLIEKREKVGINKKSMDSERSELLAKIDARLK